MTNAAKALRVIEIATAALREIAALGVIEYAENTTVMDAAEKFQANRDRFANLLSASDLRAKRTRDVK